MLLNSLYSENECLRVQLTSLVLLEKTIEMDIVSRIGTVALFPLSMFQLLTMTFLPLLIRNPAICRVSTG